MVSEDNKSDFKSRNIKLAAVEHDGTARRTARGSLLAAATKKPAPNQTQHNY
jgi:hypothetical protein